jgi:hypothetical protein
MERRGSTGRRDRPTENGDSGAEVFRRVLVAIDESSAARAAFVFVSDLARQFDAQVWFIQLTDESGRRRCGIATDVGRRGRQVANHFSVSGATLGARDHQMVGGIAEAAQAFRADLIVLGFDPGRVARRRFRRSVREQLTKATSVPVLIAPRRVPTVHQGAGDARRHGTHDPVRNAIPLGPAGSHTTWGRGSRGAHV